MLKWLETWHIFRDTVDTKQKICKLLALVSLIVALVTTLLNDNVSRKGLEGMERIPTRMGWGGESLFSLKTGKVSSLQNEHKKNKGIKNIKIMRTGISPHPGKSVTQISPL